MNNFEIFEKVITGDLRPHKYESDGKALEDKIQKLGITDEDFSKYIKFLDKKGKSYSIKISDPETGETIIDEKRNEEFNELIDIDIPPVPDKKGEVYLELIELEYARNILTIDKYINDNSKEKLEEYAIRNLQILRNLWQDLKHYKKLLVEEKGLDYKKSNDFVLMILEVYLERSLIHLHDAFEPYLSKEYLSIVIDEIFGEKQRRLKEMEAMLSKGKFRKMTDVDKKFDAIFEQLTRANTIEEKVFNEIEFWKKHRYEKIDGISDEELKFISKSMVESFESELDKARVTGWIRGDKIELEKADRLYRYMLEIVKEYAPSIRNKNMPLNGNEINIIDEEETDRKLQRDRIRKYLLEHHPGIKNNINLNLNGLAYEIIDEFYPGIKGSERRKKKESIRQELMLFKKGNLDL